MQRRQYLAALGLTASVAGCSGGGGSDAGGTGSTPTATATPTPTPAETATATPTPEPASFELGSVRSPETIEIGSDYQIEFTIRNVGEQDGVFTSALSYRTPRGDWQITNERLRLEVPAGREATWTSQAVTFDYMQELEFRLDALGTTWPLQVVSKTLAFGRPYVNPDEIELAVTNLSFADSYEYSIDQYDYVEEPPDASQWLFVAIHAENVSGSPAYAPLAQDFVALVGNQQFDARVYRRESQAYEGGEIQAGVVRRGDVLFAVPVGASESDIEVVWSESYYDGDVAAYWRENPGG
jgi:hypothetical protein